MQSFGPALKELRGQLGLSQSALALELGTTQRHVSFLETGRSQPGRAMIARMVAELDLSAAQRAALFDASGYRNPYKRRSFDSAEVTEALDLIENRLLVHWPFPAFVMDPDWNVLRINAPGAAMFGAFAGGDNRAINLLELFLSPQFRNLIGNWEEASATLYFRMQAAAGHSAFIAEKLESARAGGLFDHISGAILSADEIPIFVPITMNRPDGVQLKLTSMMGQLVSVHDALVEGFEIELMVPVDAASEACLLEHLPQG